MPHYLESVSIIVLKDANCVSGREFLSAFNHSSVSFDKLITSILLSYLQECILTKNFSDTVLHVYWTGVLRVTSCTTCCKRWYFTFNGAECSGPLPIDGIVYLGRAAQNPHRVRHIEGHCNNVHKGKVRVGFWVGNCRGLGNADANTGWNSVSRIFIEEVPAPQP